MIGAVRSLFWVWLCAMAALYRWQAGKQFDHAHEAFARGEALEIKAVDTRARADAVRVPKTKRPARRRRTS